MGEYGIGGYDSHINLDSAINWNKHVLPEIKTDN